MIISDLSNLEVLSEDNNVIGGISIAQASADAFASGPNAALTSAQTFTQTFSTNFQFFFQSPNSSKSQSISQSASS